MLRQAIRRRQKNYTVEALQILSAALLRTLSVHPRVRLAHTLLLYMALSDEVDTRPLIDELHREGKQIVLPVVLDDRDLQLRLYTPGAPLVAGRFGIMEPTGPVFRNYSQIEVALIPGVGIDKNGHRLGRGKGYYDRFLAKCPTIYKIGVCYPFQLVDRLPTEAHDIAMDEVIWQPQI